MPTTQSCVQLAYEQSPRYENAPAVSPYAVSTAVRYMPITSLGVTPAPGLMDRSDELRGVEGAVPQLLDSFTPGGSLAVRAYVNDMVFLLGLAGFQATVVAGAATADVWTITETGVPTGGSFTVAITPGGGTLVTTGPIPYNATAAQVGSAIKGALDASGQTGVQVLASGGPLPAGVVITFAGSASGRAGTVALGVNSLTGGTTPAPVFTHTGTGAAGGSTALPDGGFPTTGTNVWTFAKRTGLNAKSAQILAAYFNEQVFLQGQGFVLSALGGNAAGAITGTLEGLVLKRINDPNLAPAYDTQAIPPMREGDMFLSWIAGGATVSDFTWSIANPVERIRSLGVASYYPDTMYQGPGRALVTGTIPKRAVNATDFDAMMQAGTFAAVATWHSPKQIGTSGYTYSMFMQMPSAQITGGDADPLTNARRFGASYNWMAAYDEAAGYDVQFVLVTSLASTAVASAGVGL